MIRRDRAGKLIRDRPRAGQQMEQNKRLLAAWQNGVVLGHAWWAFADKRNKKTFRELQRRGEHLGLQRSLEIDLIARLFAGELQAIGIEDGSDAGPIHIPQYYFSRTAEIDWDKETVTAIGKKFHEITIQRERGPADKVLGEPMPLDPRLNLDPREIERALGLADDSPSSEPAPSNEPPIPGEQESTKETPLGAQAPSRKPKMGRPLLLPKVREIVRELIDHNDFANLMKIEIETLIRSKVKERFPEFFPKPGHPSKNTINKALVMEGWPPPRTAQGS